MSHLLTSEALRDRKKSLVFSSRVILARNHKASAKIFLLQVLSNLAIILCFTFAFAFSLTFSGTLARFARALLSSALGLGRALGPSFPR